MNNATETALRSLGVLTKHLEEELSLAKRMYEHYHLIYETSKDAFESAVALGHCVAYSSTRDMLEFNIRLHKEYMAELEGGAK